MPAKRTGQEKPVIDKNTKNPNKQKNKENEIKSSFCTSSRQWP